MREARAPAKFANFAMQDDDERQHLLSAARLG